MERRAIKKQWVVVEMPAYNAEQTLKQTYDELPHDLVDRVILVDDASKDGTVDLARRLDLTLVVQESNKGCGANQKTCYSGTWSLSRIPLSP